MHSGPLVGRYTRALFEVAAEQNALESVRADLELLGEVLAKTPELAEFLRAPGTTIAQKQQLLVSAFADRLGEITRRFLHVLLEKHRIAILPEVVRNFDVLWREEHEEVLVTVTTAVEPDSRLKEAITGHLRTLTEKNPVITWLADPSLIGGMQVRWPDRIEDSTLRRKLIELRQSLAVG
jgi:F-type H+-transporting ATPase subunit delta